MSSHVSHWDDAPHAVRNMGPLVGDWHFLGRAAGSRDLGASRIQVPAGKRSTPAHIEGDEEEIFYVLAGSGLSWQDGETFEVGPGDCLLHPVLEQAHTMIAGPDGLDVIAFGERATAQATHLPRAGVFWLGAAWVADGVAAGHPWEQEVAAGELQMPDAPSPRPRRIVNSRDVEEERLERGRTAIRERDLGGAVGSERTGLTLAVVEAGCESYPPHMHSAEEELFIVLDGSGVAVLGEDEYPLRAGSIVARPPRTRVAHQFRADPGNELTYLAYSNHIDADIAFLPRSGKVYLRGIGMMFRPERLDYWDGEE